MKKILLASVAVTLGCLSPLAHAAEIAVFDFEGGIFPAPARFNQPYAVKARAGEGVIRQEERSGGRSNVAVVTEQKGYIFAPRGDSALLGELSSLTLSFSFKVDEAVPTPVFIQRINSSSANPGYFSFHSQHSHGDAAMRDGTLRMVVTADGNAHTASSSERWKQVAGEWNNVAMVFNQGTVSFYLNGSPVGKPIEMEVRTIPYLEPMGKGWLRGASGFNGAFDDIVILPNKVLGESQIKLLHESGVHSPAALEMLKP